jgi:hypothetical protein
MDYFDLAVADVLPEELLLTGAEVVVNCRLGAILHEPVDDMAADKAGAARNQCPMDAA